MAKPTFDPIDGFAVTPVDRGGLVIKPCPFCGSAPEICRNEHKGWIVFCDGESHLAQCGAFLTLQGAIDEWNRRQA